MFYLLLSIELALLLAIIVALWTKLIATLPSHDVRWFFGGAMSLATAGLAVTTGLVYFEQLPVPSPFHEHALIRDEPARQWTFVAAVVFAAMVIVTTTIGLWRVQPGIFAPARAGQWSTRKPAAAAAVLLCMIGVTVGLRDWWCVRELMARKVEGENILADLRSRYAGDVRPSLMEVLDELWRTSGLTEEEYWPYDRAVQASEPAPPFPSRGEELLRGLEMLPATRQANLPRWLDPDSLPDLDFPSFGKTAGLVAWRMETAEPVEFWRVSSIWSEVIARLEHDPAPQVAIRLMGARRQLARYVQAAIVAREDVLRAYRADSWNSNYAYERTTLDRFRWLKARNLLQVAKAGLSGEAPGDNSGLLIYSTDNPNVDAPNSSTSGIIRRLSPRFWREAGLYLDTLAAFEPVADNPPLEMLLKLNSNVATPGNSLGNFLLLDGAAFGLARAELYGALSQRLTHVEVACFAYVLEHGQAPDRLADLVPRYLSSIPVDPFSDSAIKYARSGRKFKIYSIGVDLSDDGGDVGPHSNLADFGAEYVVKQGRAKESH